MRLERPDPVPDQVESRKTRPDKRADMFILYVDCYGPVKPSDAKYRVAQMLHISPVEMSEVFVAVMNSGRVVWDPKTKMLEVP